MVSSAEGALLDSPPVASDAGEELSSAGASDETALVVSSPAGVDSSVAGVDSSIGAEVVSSAEAGDSDSAGAEVVVATVVVTFPVTLATVGLRATVVAKDDPLPTSGAFVLGVAFAAGFGVAFGDFVPFVGSSDLTLLMVESSSKARCCGVL